MKKQCITCHESKDLEEFHLRRSGGTARRSECKLCERKRWRKNAQNKKKEKKTPLTGVLKVCTGCGEEKDTSLYDKDPSGAGGLHSRCKTCRARKNTEYVLKIS